MKKIVVLLVFLISNIGLGVAQKVAIVDIGAVLEAVPEYKKAQEDLDKISTQWRQEINQELDKIKSMYNKYQAEQVIMSDEMRKQKEDEITKKEKDVRELQKEKFGPEGSLFKKRQELIKPIQDRVFKAVEDFATEKAYDVVLDKSSSSGILFANAAIEKTADIIRKLGITIK
ncbi:MAG: OmpH family outer membrane protein [Saprospiraceae bacterium]|jgi:outer membrane protein|nr:OmpH family outer membrane protein [Saprospiraceae bacterium]